MGILKGFGYVAMSGISFLSNFGEARPIAQIVESTILIERKVLSESIQLNFLHKLPQSKGVSTITVTTHPTNPQLLVKMCELSLSPYPSISLLLQTTRKPPALSLNRPGQGAEEQDEEYPAQEPQNHHHISPPAYGHELGGGGGDDAARP